MKTAVPLYKSYLQPIAKQSTILRISPHIALLLFRGWHYKYARVSGILMQIGALFPEINKYKKCGTFLCITGSFEKNEVRRVEVAAIFSVLLLTVFLGLWACLESSCLFVVVFMLLTEENVFVTSWFLICALVLALFNNVCFWGSYLAAQNFNLGS